MQFHIHRTVGRTARSIRRNQIADGSLANYKAAVIEATTAMRSRGMRVAGAAYDQCYRPVLRVKPKPSQQRCQQRRFWEQMQRVSA